jgi:Protein of unknown function (DUF2612)
MSTADLISYYQELLIMQYFQKRKAAGMVGAMVGEIIADSLAFSVQDGFNLDTAIGAQLDKLGAYRNVSRIYHGLNISKTYMSMPSQSDSFTGLKGFADDSLGSTVSWYFLRVQDVLGGVSSLSDSDFRQLIKFVASYSAQNISIGVLDQILFSMFGSYVTVTDNGNMTLTYNDSPSDPNKTFYAANKELLVPHPAGVSYSVTNL